MKHKAQKRIGALTIGQSPRPDLVSPLVRLMPDCEIIQAGALDGLTPEELPDISEAAYPLVTQMQNGAVVMVDESYIAPKLQQAQNLLDAKGVQQRCFSPTCMEPNPSTNLLISVAVC